jgi:hypothetical protein
MQRSVLTAAVISLLLFTALLGAWSLKRKRATVRLGETTAGVDASNQIFNPSSTVTNTSVVAPVKKLTGEVCEVHGLQLYSEKPRRVINGLTFYGLNPRYPHPGVYLGGCMPEHAPPATIPTCDACISGHEAWASNFSAKVQR